MPMERAIWGSPEGLQPIQHFLGDDAIDPHPAEADAIGDGFGAEVLNDGAILLEQNDEWAVQRARYMTLETIAPLSDNAIVSLPAAAD